MLHSYSSFGSPFQAKTGTPRAAIAAAVWSWVEASRAAVLRDHRSIPGVGLRALGSPHPLNERRRWRSEPAAIIADSKTFPDVIPDAPPEAILDEYCAAKEAPNFDLATFVRQHFTGPTPPGPP
jgi:hypothetical protein